MWRVAFAELRKLRRPTLFLGTMGAVVSLHYFSYLLIHHKEILIVDAWLGEQF